MPAYWSRKDERQYQHILRSCRGRRGGDKRCRRIAAATVNKRRRYEGRTLSGFAAVTPLRTRGFKDGRHAWVDIVPTFGPPMRITHTIGADLSRRPTFEGLGRLPGERTALLPPRPVRMQAYCLARDPFTKKCKIYATRPISR